VDVGWVPGALEVLDEAATTVDLERVDGVLPTDLVLVAGLVLALTEADLVLEVAGLVLALALAEADLVLLTVAALVLALAEADFVLVAALVLTVDDFVLEAAFVLDLVDEEAVTPRGVVAYHSETGIPKHSPTVTPFSPRFWSSAMSLGTSVSAVPW